VSASADASLKIWDTDAAREEWSLRGHGGPVTDCAYSPDGRRVVSSSADGTLRVWDAGSGRGLFELSGHCGAVHGCGWSADGSLIVSASWREIGAWDARTGMLRTMMPAHASHRHASVCVPGGNWIVAASDDRTLTVWDVERGRPAARFPVDGLSCLARGPRRAVACGTAAGHVFLLRAMGLGPAPPVVTATFLYRFDRRAYEPHASAPCDACGRRLVVPQPVLDAIAAAHTSPASVPSIPDGSRQDARLLSACPHCGEALRFNPFLANDWRDA
jgi:WD40 repeat protein